MRTISSENHYNVLGVLRNATDGEIKKAYHSLARKWHPDKNKLSTEADERFKQIQKAYEILSNPITRALHDESIVKKVNEYEKNGPIFATAFFHTNMPSSNHEYVPPPPPPPPPPPRFFSDQEEKAYYGNHHDYVFEGGGLNNCFRNSFANDVLFNEISELLLKQNRPYNQRSSVPRTTTINQQPEYIYKDYADEYVDNVDNYVNPPQPIYEENVPFFPSVESKQPAAYYETRPTQVFHYDVSAYQNGQINANANNKLAKQRAQKRYDENAAPKRNQISRLQSSTTIPSIFIDQHYHHRHRHHRQHDQILKPASTIAFADWDPFNDFPATFSLNRTIPLLSQAREEHPGLRTHWNLHRNHLMNHLTHCTSILKHFIHKPSLGFVNDFPWYTNSNLEIAFI